MASSSHQKRPSPGLVDYSDSDGDGDDVAPSPKDPVASSLPPLPSKFHDLYTAAPRLAKADDPAAHGGRHRAIPHVEGNWPTHIYFEWHLNSTEAATVGHILSVARDAIAKHERFSSQRELPKLESFLHSDLGTQLPLHISMSRPIVLRTEQRDQFMASLEKGLDRIGVEPFDATFTSLEWVPNQDRTRWFWVMRASSGRGKHSPLTNLLAMCNGVVRQHGQPGLYSVDSGGNTRDGFHVSVGWSLREPTAGLREEVALAVEGGQEVDKLSALTMRCETLKVKIGNTVHALELKRGV
ncbi:poly(U)-specific 3'-to-5' RNA exonuclease [Orbilia brochopaga]|uniref:U6 snRNA phosphodiesterase n=1 Tax=Orbilia brochopaga TaxID=3140254 RepID=A0AAV9U793_9PEZI